jgi:hypothetical protein
MPPPVSGRWVIFTALEYEARALRKVLGSGVELRVVGPRATRLPAPAELSGRAGILMAGLGGALDPELETGEVVIDGEIPMSNPPRRRRGAIHTADRIVATPAEKALLFRQTRALVVDMESAAARGLAAAIGVPFLGVRAISDRADEPLDPAVLRLVDSSGRLRPSRLARELVRRPTFVQTLLRLRPGSELAMTNLAAALREILTDLSFSRAPGTTTP